MEPSFVPMAASALAAGLLFGYAAQRGGFCLMRALSNLVLMGDATIARAYLLALLVAVVGTYLLTAAGPHFPSLEFAEAIPVRPFRWLANLVGGFAFGIGMVMTGGCAGSTWYRLGEGALGAGIVLLGFALGATATNVGLLAPVRQALQQPELTVAEGAPTLYTLGQSLFGVPPWVVVAVAVVGGGIWLARGRGEPEHGKWRWPLTGTVIGLVIALGWYLSSFGGAPVGITFAENTGHLLTYPLVWFPNRITWGMLLLVGVPLGAGLAARRTGDLGWKVPAPSTTLQLFGGGLIMGTGALVAQGCNITQGLTYSATLALGSLTAFAAMVAGACATLWFRFLRK